MCPFSFQLLSFSLFQDVLNSSLLTPNYTISPYTCSRIIVIIIIVIVVVVIVIIIIVITIIITIIITLVKRERKGKVIPYSFHKKRKNVQFNQQSFARLSSSDCQRKR